MLQTALSIALSEVSLNLFQLVKRLFLIKSARISLQGSPRVLLSNVFLWPNYSKILSNQYNNESDSYHKKLYLYKSNTVSYSYKANTLYMYILILNFSKKYTPLLIYSDDAHFSIFQTESLVKMSNSLLFSRIFTLQSSSWFCFNYSFWLGVYYYESEKFFLFEFKNVKISMFPIFKIYWF